MSEDKIMAKDPAHMTHAERMAWLIAELNSSSAVGRADKVLELITHEWMDVVDVRAMAARRQGDTSSPPTAPFATAPVVEAPTELKDQILDGTLGGLILCYRTDKRSTYHSLRFRTRENYDGLLRRLEPVANTPIADIKEQQIQNLYDVWTDGGQKKVMGHSLIAMLRILANFGGTVLKDQNSDRLAITLHRFKIPVAAPRVVRLTEKHVVDIIKMAHEMHLHSIAITQAFQADGKLMQKDCIGEWVPDLSEPDESDVRLADEKWLRGIRWESYDRKKMILTHTTSAQLKPIVINVRKCPLIMAEFDRIGDLPTSGPIVVCDYSGVPWKTSDFRRQWRRVARAAGVPDAARNMDSVKIGEKDSPEADEVLPEDSMNLDIDFEVGTTPH